MFVASSVNATYLKMSRVDTDQSFTSFIFLILQIRHLFSDNVNKELRVEFLSQLSD